MTRANRIPAVLLVVGGISLVAGGGLTLEDAAWAGGGDAKAEARALIDRAVKAHGGEANLSKFKAVTAKWAGKRRAEGDYWDAVTTVSYEMPDRIRLDSEMQNPKGGSFILYRIVNGDKGWIGAGVRSRDLKAAEMTQLVNEAYAHWLASLTPLGDKSFEFSPWGRAEVDGNETAGVKISRKGRPDVHLYVDKKTGLVLKSEHRTKDPFTGEEFNAESIYRDHKAFDGVLWPTKRLDKRDGKELEGDSGRVELSDFQAHEKLDERLFTKPCGCDTF